MYSPCLDSEGLEKENAVLRAELKRVQVELQQIDKIKRDFIALAASELRSPVSALAGYARTLQEQATGETRQSAEIIQARACRLKQIVDAIVTLQQFDTGLLALRLEVTSVADAIREAVTTLRRESEQKGVLFDIQADRDLFVRADRERLAVILTHLLSNAIKYSPKSGTIKIRARAGSSLATVSISDDGIGIAPLEQMHIFDRFYKARDPLKGQDSGMGLGLAVVKTLVELHDGQLWVESTHQRGSTFHFSLPRVIRSTLTSALIEKRLPAVL